MDLNKLYLEKMFNLPDNYTEVISSRMELTPELEKEGFHRDVYTWKNRYYNFIVKEIKPFIIRVIEQGFKANQQSGLLDYELIIADDRLFAPLKNFVVQWGKENGVDEWEKFWFNFLAAWLKRNLIIEGVEITDYNKDGTGFFQNPDKSTGMEITNGDLTFFNINRKGTGIRFLTRNEATFYQTLEHVSAALRYLNGKR